MKRRNFLKGLFTIPMVAKHIIAQDTTSDQRLEPIITIIESDENLNKKVSSSDIADAIECARSMNKIILEAIDTIGIIDNQITTDNIKAINSYIDENYRDDWRLLHGSTIDEQKSGFHKVVKSGARTKLFGENAINKVFHGIYHLGFKSEYRNRLVDENGKKSITIEHSATWLTNILNNRLYENQDELKILIPLYSYPTDVDENGDNIWDRFIEIRNRYPNVEVVAVINPDNGDFDTEDSNYSEGIKRLEENDIEILGYIYTSYAKRDREEIYKNIEAWRDIYQTYGVDGIFFDEASTNSEDLQYYKDISDYAKSAGFKKVALNAGYTTSQEYIDENIADIIITLEESEESVLNNPPSTYNNPSESTKLSLLVHDMQIADIDALIDFAIEKEFEYIYFTEDGADGNPWNSLSKYFEEELSKVMV